MKVMWFAFAFVMLTACTSSNEKNKSYTVEIKAMQFQPATLPVQKGDTVMFINNDFVVHNITEEEKKTWASPDLSPGQHFAHVVSASANYFCTIHPTMKGKIVVK